MALTDSLGASIGLRGCSGGNHDGKVQRVRGLLDLVRRFAPYHGMIRLYNIKDTSLDEIQVSINARYDVIMC